MERASTVVNRIAEMGVFLIISIMALVVFAEVIFRYALPLPLFWTEEFARYCLVWSSLLGAGVALKKGEHMAVTFLADRLPKGIQMGTVLFVRISIAALLGVILCGGLHLVAITRHQLSPAMRIPMSWPYLAVPVGSLIMLFHEFTFIYAQLREISGTGRYYNILVGAFRGGLAYINVVISMFFAGITGAAVADTSAVGSILIPAMKKEGYDVGFSTAVTVSTIGPIIPTSIPFIIYGVLGEVSIASLFLAGIIPGVLLGLLQMGVVAYFARKRDYPKGSPISSRGALRATFDAALVLMMPLIILGGILTGMFTPTESACVAVFYSLIISVLVYRDIRLRDLPKIIVKTGVTSSLVMLVIGTASIFSWLLASEEIPQYLTQAVTHITHNRMVILLLLNILLLIVGTFMETAASLIILTPVLLPLMNKIGVDPLHFGVILVLNLVISLTTPPVGVCLFIACAIGEIRLEQITRSILPFLLASITVLLIVTYWESLVMAIPKLFGYEPVVH